uniref:Uncharacterized protein n=1 Tax=Ixodes ricinus TaxID=34613 RepID=A0A6B0UXC6_IXORI
MAAAVVAAAAATTRVVLQYGGGARHRCCWRASLPGSRGRRGIFSTRLRVVPAVSYVRSEWCSGALRCWSCRFHDDDDQTRQPRSCRMATWTLAATTVMLGTLRSTSVGSVGLHSVVRQSCSNTVWSAFLRTTPLRTRTTSQPWTKPKTTKQIAMPARSQI